MNTEHVYTIAALNKMVLTSWEKHHYGIEDDEGALEDGEREVREWKAEHEKEKGRTRVRV